MPCLSCFSSSVSYVGYPHFHLGCPSGPSCPPACNPRCPSMRSPHVTCGRRLLFSHCSPQRPYIFVHMWLSCFHRLLFTESSPNLVCAEKSRLFPPPFRVASYVPPVLETKPPHPLCGEFAPSPPAARCGCLPSQPSALCRRPSYPSELTLPASIAVLFPKHQPPSAFLGSHSSTCHLRVRFLFVAHLPAPVQPPARPRLSRPPASPCPHSLCVLIHWASIQDTHQAPASALWWGTGRRPPLSLRRISQGGVGVIESFTNSSARGPSAPGSTLRLRSSRAAVRGH